MTPGQGKTYAVEETAPVKRIVGIFSIREVHEETPAAIWKKTSEYAGIDEGRFFEYFSGRDTAYAIEIAEVKKYVSPIDPWEVNERFVPPQSFMYLDDVTYGRHILFSGFVQGPDDDSGYLFSKQTLR